LEPQRDDGFPDFRGDRARRIAEEHFRDLLRNRRSAFGRAEAYDVVNDRAANRDRIDAEVLLETAILGGDGGVRDGWRDVIQPLVARAGGRQRLIENDAVAIDDGRRRVGRNRRNWSEANPQRERDQTAGEAAGGPCETGLDHGLTSTTSLAVLPNTSGSYISSANIGAVMNVPAVVARTM